MDWIDIQSPYRVSFDGSFDLARSPTRPPDGAAGKKALNRERKEFVSAISDLQERLYAEDKQALLLVFQAMDAAGKDSTIRAVMTGVNPAGVQVHSFKKPSARELGHDFMWRTNVRLPERGQIGVFNRSYYEETLVVRVHPQYLEAQRLPSYPSLDALWDNRFESIRSQERHLAQSGTVVVKFWLNVSRDAQRDRFLSRIDKVEKNWKFNTGDLAERARWDDYMHAYEQTLRATSRPWAPWYAIPADDKPFMRRSVAQIIAQTLERMAPQWPQLNEVERAELQECRQQLVGQSQ
jgi:PPK2 family polyphosphate:nucleotide phosphotransferase